MCRSPLEHLHYSELVIVVSYQMNNLFPSYIMARTSYIWWDEDDGHFVLEEHT
jgi:hypothetical protein